MHTPPRDRLCLLPAKYRRADPTPRTRGPASPAGASAAQPRGRALEERTWFLHSSSTPLTCILESKAGDRDLTSSGALETLILLPGLITHPVYLLLIAPGGQVCSFPALPSPILLPPRTLRAEWGQAQEGGALKERRRGIGMRPRAERASKIQING